MPDPEQAKQSRRTIRSFVLRKGRLTDAQARALEELWPEFGIDSQAGVLNSKRLFGRDAPLVLEIGFGNGEATWRMARNEPQKDFIGVEVHKPGVGQLLRAIQTHGLMNVRIACTDAVEFIHEQIAGQCLAEVRIFFPDPWPKKRHHKRRIIQTPFVDLLASRMIPGGILHLATDWQPYAEHMLDICNQHPAFANQSQTGDYCHKPLWRPETKYESRGERLGHQSRDILLQRKC